MIKLERWFVIGVLSLLLGACTTLSAQSISVATVPVVPTSTPSATASVAPSLVPTLAPTATSTPIADPQPTASATPIETATPLMAAVPISPAWSLPPIGLHADSIDLALTSTRDLTRTTVVSYLLYLPQNYGVDPAQQWPLILYLHGSDVWGTDPDDLIASGLPQHLTATLDFPAIVLAPQAPENAVWWGAELDLVRLLLDQVQTAYAIDPKRIYLTGPSMGGFGVWALALQQPQRFAAIMPIVGGWNSENDSIPRNICAIKTVPVWVIHGAQDDIVPPRKAELLVNALQKCGGQVRFTLYPDADHRTSFERAYNDPEVYAWLFAQHLP